MVRKCDVIVETAARAFAKGELCGSRLHPDLVVGASFPLKGRDHAARRALHVRPQLDLKGGRLAAGTIDFASLHRCHDSGVMLG